MTPEFSIEMTPEFFTVFEQREFFFVNAQPAFGRASLHWLCFFSLKQCLPIDCGVTLTFGSVFFFKAMFANQF